MRQVASRVVVCPRLRVGREHVDQALRAQTADVFAEIDRTRSKSSGSIARACAGHGLLESSSTRAPVACQGHRRFKSCRQTAVTADTLFAWGGGAR